MAVAMNTEEPTEKKEITAQNNTMKTKKIRQKRNFRE
jgi:hypothetical protein